MTDVIVTTVFQPLPGAKDALVAALREAIPGVHDEPGCQLYAIHDAEDGSIVMLEKWTSKDDLDAHSKGSAVKRLQELTRDHLAGPVVVTLMTALPAGSAEQGLL